MNKEQRTQIELLFGEYWDIAFSEGSLGVNKAHDANRVVFQLKEVLDKIENDTKLQHKILKNSEYGSMHEYCVINPLSSRMCELGVKSCVVEHSETKGK